jgi:hypothetical protein
MPPAHSGVAAHHADPVLQRAQRVHGGLPFFGIVFCLRQLGDGVCASWGVTGGFRPGTKTVDSTTPNPAPAGARPGACVVS